MVKLLFLAGSARRGSLNKNLARIAARMAKKSGAQASFIDLKDFEMPLYDGDSEAERGLPEKAKELKKLFVSHDGFFIASPEYNSSMPALLKNSLDWISRPETEKEAPLIAFAGKTAALGAVSPGGLGGLRGLVPLRMMLGNIGVSVIPSQIAVGAGFQAFDEEGQLEDDGETSRLQGVIDEFIKITGFHTK